MPNMIQVKECGFCNKNLPNPVEVDGNKSIIVGCKVCIEAYNKYIEKQK